MKTQDPDIHFNHRTQEEKAQYIQTLKMFINWFEQEFKVNVYLIYGTLLGAYREQRFLGHDYDVDIAYLSNESELDKVIIEKDIILKKLDDMGLLAKKFGDGHNHVWSLDKQICFDVWSSWIVDNKFYCTGFYNGQFGKEIVLPFSKCLLESAQFKVPYDTDAFLTTYYGNWRTPQLSWKQTTTWVGLPFKT